MAVLVYLILSLVSIVFIFLHRKNQYFKVRNIPYVEPELFYGNSRGLMKTYQAGDFMKRMYSQLKGKGPVGGVFMFIRPVTLVLDLDMVKNMLTKDFQTFPHRGLYHCEKHDPLSCHLVNLEDDSWRSLRQKLTPTFTASKLKQMFDIFLPISDSLLATIEKESSATGQVEVKDIFARFTTDVIGSAAFGIECNSLEDKNAKFYTVGLEVISSVNFVKRALMMSFRDIARALRMKEMDQNLGQFYIDAVQSTIDHRKKNPEFRRNDLMRQMIKLMDSDGPEKLTFNQVVSQCMIFFLAGFETSSTTLSFCMYELAVNEDIQEKVRQSVNDVFERHDNQLTYEAVSEMNYLEQCINESLRKYPPFFYMPRIAKHNFKIPNSDIVIEKGQAMGIPIVAYHWDPEYFPEPEKYDPDRFTPENIAKRHPCAFIPFGTGARVCIAMKFAMAEIKIALAKILINYKFSLDRTKTTVPLVIAPNKWILTSTAGVFVNMEKIFDQKCS